MIPGKEHLKKIYFALHKAIGSDERQLHRIHKTGLVPILNFHRVSEIENNFWSPLHPQLFEELLQYLQKNFALLRFSELQEETKLPKAVLSFDDGYIDFYEVAAPILKKYGIRANMNIIPSVVLGGAEPWHAQLYDFLQFAPDTYVERIRLAGFSDTLNRSSKAQRAQYGLRISRHLKNRPRAELEQIWKPLGELIQDWRLENPRPRQFMNLAEIKSITADHEIGAHSFSHASMAFETEEFFQSDFQQCLGFFEEQLHQKLSIYAFPNGSYRDEQVSYLLAQKVESVLLVGEALSEANKRVHKRITISADSLFGLKLQSLGHFAN